MHGGITAETREGEEIAAAKKEKNKQPSCRDFQLKKKQKGTEQPRLFPGVVTCLGGKYLAWDGEGELPCRNPRQPRRESGQSIQLRHCKGVRGPHATGTELGEKQRRGGGWDIGRTCPGGKDGRRVKKRRVEERNLGFRAREAKKKKKKNSSSDLDTRPKGKRLDQEE